MQQTLAFLAGEGEPGLAEMARLGQAFLGDGRLELADHFFWTSPLAMWEMPDDILEDLSRADLVISKGDANYRRLLGDRHWSFTTSLVDILCYFPAPLLALRTLKSVVAAGLPPGQAEKAARQDPSWLVNGRWGVIQFYDGNPGAASGS